jgi:hypothetical protein
VEKGLVRDFGFLRSAAVIGGYVHLSFDRALLLTSDAANAYAAAHGIPTPVPNDYLIVNPDQRLRELVLAPGVTITGTAHLAGGSTDPRPVTTATLVAILSTDHDVPVMVTFDRSLRVVTVSEPYFP